MNGWGGNAKFPPLFCWDGWWRREVKAYGAVAGTCFLYTGGVFAFAARRPEKGGRKQAGRGTVMFSTSLCWNDGVAQVGLAASGAVTGHSSSGKNPSAFAAQWPGEREGEVPALVCCGVRWHRRGCRREARELRVVVFAFISAV